MRKARSVGGEIAGGAARARDAVRRNVAASVGAARRAVVLISRAGCRDGRRRRSGSGAQGAWVGLAARRGGRLPQSQRRTRGAARDRRAPLRSGGAEGWAQDGHPGLNVTDPHHHQPRRARPAGDPHRLAGLCASRLLESDGADLQQHVATVAPPNGSYHAWQLGCAWSNDTSTSWLSTRRPTPSPPACTAGSCSPPPPTTLTRAAASTCTQRRAANRLVADGRRRGRALCLPPHRRRAAALCRRRHRAVSHTSSRRRRRRSRRGRHRRRHRLSSAAVAAAVPPPLAPPPPSPAPPLPWCSPSPSPTPTPTALRQPRRSPPPSKRGVGAELAARGERAGGARCRLDGAEADSGETSDAAVAAATIVESVVASASTFSVETAVAAVEIISDVAVALGAGNATAGRRRPPRPRRRSSCSRRSTGWANGCWMRWWRRR